jgi:hypothetical protein
MAMSVSLSAATILDRRAAAAIGARFLGYAMRRIKT